MFILPFSIFLGWLLNYFINDVRDEIAALKDEVEKREQILNELSNINEKDVHLATNKNIDLNDEDYILNSATLFLRNLLKAPNWEIMIPHVYLGEEKRFLMERYYERYMYQAKRDFVFTNKVLRNVGGRTLIYFQGFDNDNQTNFEAVLEKVTGQGFLLHWEAYARLSAFQWDYFISKKPNIPTELRVYLMINNYEQVRANQENIEGEESEFSTFWMYHQDKSYGFPFKVMKNTPIYNFISSKLEINPVCKFTIHAHWELGERGSDEIVIDQIDKDSWLW